MIKVSQNCFWIQKFGFQNSDWKIKIQLGQSLKWASSGYYTANREGNCEHPSMFENFNLESFFTEKLFSNAAAAFQWCLTEHRFVFHFKVLNTFRKHCLVVLTCFFWWVHSMKTPDYMKFEKQKPQIKPPPASQHSFAVWLIYKAALFRTLEYQKKIWL